MRCVSARSVWRICLSRRSADFCESFFSRSPSIRKMVGRERSRAKYRSPSFLPTTSVDFAPLSPEAVNVMAGAARPYPREVVGLFAGNRNHFGVGNSLKQRIHGVLVGEQAWGAANFHSSLSFEITRPPAEFLRSNDATCSLFKCRMARSRRPSSDLSDAGRKQLRQQRHVLPAVNDRVGRFTGEIVVPDQNRML